LQLLFFHSDFIEFEAKLPTKMEEEIDDQARKGRLKESLCAFIAVEKFDEDDTDAVVAKSSKQISDVAGQVHASRIMIYPYAHLSSQLSTPATAAKILKGMQETLSGDYEVMRAPFGWNKGLYHQLQGPSTL
jgi:threonyl-tRNA synthetase